MEVNLLNLRNSINKAFLKVRPNRTCIEAFKKNISGLLDQIKESESEEFHKNIISEFLKNTYYSPGHYINTKGRADLVIHNGKDTNTPVGVLFEIKKPSNRQDMPSTTGLNTKAFHELILYFMRERIKGKNVEIKNLIITNVLEWFIFNSNDFERIFASDKNFVKQFTEFEERGLSGTNTDFFYNAIAGPFIESSELQIPVTYFDIRDFEPGIKNNDCQDDNKLIALYKIFSPEHLLKLPFANDSNTLDKTFYSELLHIIGLEETKEGSKKIIGRKKPEKRNQASLIENAITILKYEDCLSRLSKRSDFGRDEDEQLFNVALELAITWINRILFLKLLEGQLVRYNSGDKELRFLNIVRVHDYDELNKLFFQVLAVKESDRDEKIKEKFGNIPYLNSSLFEPGDLEHSTIRISNLDDHLKLPVLSSSVLKDKTGKKLTGEINPLQYLLEFLDSYDFSGEGSEEIQEENKTLINASVLGLIFEKINGYRDGSFFTPGFITMYMCHETIRRAVVQKFNEAKGWKCETINSVYNKIEDIEEANKIINSLRICDPAVGSGHFLVSALNEIIAIKSELKVLTDKEGKRLKEYTIEVINDELIITDEQSVLFEYNPKSRESQRVQETLFKEKQIIIENCLFGVDINPNSVKICRLRLWIELLKNAYYKSPHAANRMPHAVLETLPNIDINIKCGNSLISRYPLDADIKTALKSSKWNVDNYREAVMSYRNAGSKDEKRSLEQLIASIKNDFETEVSKSDRRFVKLNKLNGELLGLTGQSSLFEMTKAQKEEWNKKVKKLTEEIKKYEAEIEEIKSNKIYENAFEWRFEFPEVLNNDGDFIGFDVVIGNPPYGVNLNEIIKIADNSFSTKAKTDSYQFFFIKALAICKIKGITGLIVPNSWLSRKAGYDFRRYLLKKEILVLINFVGTVFEDASIDTCITIAKNNSPNNSMVSTIQLIHPKDISNSLLFNNIPIEKWIKIGKITCSLNLSEYNLLNKILSNSVKLGEVSSVIGGYKPYQVGYGKSVYGDFPQNDEDVLNRVYHSNIKLSSEYYPDIKGNNINRFFVTKNTQWVKWGNWLMSPKSKDLFLNKKIVVREIIGNGLIAAYDERGYFANDTTHIITNDSKEVLLFILGILNSKLMSWFFRKYFGEENELFPKVKINELKDLPIKRQIDFQFKISEIALKIMHIKETELTADTSALEAEIDRLVYELYGLTEEEIRIVEGVKA